MSRSPIPALLATRARFHLNSWLFLLAGGRRGRRASQGAGELKDGAGRRRGQLDGPGPPDSPESPRTSPSGHSWVSRRSPERHFLGFLGFPETSRTSLSGLPGLPGGSQNVTFWASWASWRLPGLLLSLRRGRAAAQVTSQARAGRCVLGWTAAARIAGVHGCMQGVPRWWYQARVVPYLYILVYPALYYPALCTLPVCSAVRPVCPGCTRAGLSRGSFWASHRPESGSSQASQKEKATLP